MSMPAPAPDPAANLYRGSSGRAYHEGKRALHPDAAAWVMALRARKFQPHVRDTDAVFELGVGAGWNLGRLRCQRRVGSDAAEFLSDRVAGAGIEFVPDIEKVASDSFDVAICHHTLEHLLKPDEALAELRRLLKPGGRLILHVPWERESRYARHVASEPNHHLYTWNAQTLGNLVTLCDFQVENVRVRRYGYDRFAANLAVRTRLGEPGFRLLRRVMIILRPLLEVELIGKKP